MTDKELIELAAKAAGAKWHFNQLDHPACWRIENTPWNPLTDDGAKWRLAKQLRFIVDFSNELYRVGSMEDSGVLKEWLAHDKDDGYAIVRAAAEIGKGMK